MDRTQPARRRGSLGVKAPGGDEEPGPTPSLGRAPGVNLVTGTSGLIASSEPDCEGLCFFEA